MRLSVEWDVPVTGPAGGLLNWYEMKSDPNNGQNLIVCGTQRDVQENAYYGVVYASRDGGRNWKDVLEDRSSSWVTEHSCAFGERHMAYFVSEASKVVNGEPHHSLGTTRIFVSADAGATWIETARTGWADFSTSVVARRLDGRSQRLYVFYNGDSQYDLTQQTGSTLDFFTVSEDGRRVSRRHSVPGMVERAYRGVYPSSSVVVSDRSAIIVYQAYRGLTSSTGVLPMELGVARVTPQGSSKATIIADPVVGSQGNACPPSLSDSLAYDRNHEVLYLAYNDFVSNRCSIMLTASHDAGASWSLPHELISNNNNQYDAKYFPIPAVNRDGVMGVLWRGRREYSPDCWYFSVSDGSSLEDTLPLSPCKEMNTLNDQSSGFLATVIRQSKGGQPASVEITTLRDFQSRVGITATDDGVFHPIWSTVGDGFGELRTANIRVNGSTDSPGLPLISVGSLIEVTGKVAVLYGGKQRLDRQSKSVMLDISFRNEGSRPIDGPLYLEAENTSSDFGDVEMRNQIVRVSGGESSKMISCQTVRPLAPGRISSPCHLTLRFNKETNTEPGKASIVHIRFRVFCLGSG
jgi:hypothetical protein